MSTTRTIDDRLVADLYKEKLLPSIAPIGSYHAFGEGRDKDFVLYFSPLTDMPVDEAVEILESLGYKNNSRTPQNDEDYPEDDHFVAMRKDDINLMVTDDLQFYINSKRAFNVVCGLSLTSKADRILVHQIVVDGREL